VQGREPGGAEEIDCRQVQHQARRSGDLPFDVTGEGAAVRRIDLPPDRDQNRRARQVACGEDRSVVLFAPVDRPGVGAQHPTGTYCRQGGLPQSKGKIRNVGAVRIGPYVLKAVALGSSPVRL